MLHWFWTKEFQVIILGSLKQRWEFCCLFFYLFIFGFTSRLIFPHSVVSYFSFIICVCVSTLSTNISVKLQSLGNNNPYFFVTFNPVGKHCVTLHAPSFTALHGAQGWRVSLDFCEKDWNGNMACWLNLNWLAHSVPNNQTQMQEEW